jgi:bla regulator protein blaR1
MEFIHQFLPEHILQALGWTVLHSLWQAFAVALLLAAYLLAWQKTDARKRYAAGNLALGSTLLLAIATFVFYLKKAEAEPELAGEIWSEDGELISRYFYEGSYSFFSDYFTPHMPLIVMVWGIGLVFFMLKMMGGLLYIQQLKTRMISPLSAEWQEHFAQLSIELGIRRPVQLLESALAKTPMALGWLKPVVLLPIGAVNHLTPAQVEAILAHELAHVLRQDYLLNLLQSLVEMLFYFNPAVWWISAHVRTERENCCDDIAVRHCGNSLAYAKALVSLQELQMTAPALAMSFSKNKNQLLHRIKRILQPSQNKSNVMEKLSATLLLTVAVVLLSVQANTPFGNFITKVVSNEMPAMEAADAPLPYEMEYPEEEADTIPDENRDAHIHFNTDDEDIEFKMKDDEITFLKIDGKVIPPDNYGEYEAHVRDIMANVPEPPEAPEAPDFPEMPEMPEPPMPPSFERFPAPAAPPAPPAPGTRKITTQKDRNGTTFIIETQDGAEPVEITVKDGKKGTIIVNGQEITGLKKGDKTIIMQDVPGNGFGWNFPAISPDQFHFDFPAMSPEFPGFDAAAMAELEALRRSDFPEDLAREWELAATSPLNSDEWRAAMEEQRAQLDKEMAELREQQQLLMGERREEIERAMEDTRKAQQDVLKQLEQERKAARKDTKRRSGGM